MFMVMFFFRMIRVLMFMCLLIVPGVLMTVG